MNSSSDFKMTAASLKDFKKIKAQNISDVKDMSHHSKIYRDLTLNPNSNNMILVYDIMSGQRSSRVVIKNVC